MNLKLKQVFKGKVVNKAHTINTGMTSQPHSAIPCARQADDDP